MLSELVVSTSSTFATTINTAQKFVKNANKVQNTGVTDLIVMMANNQENIIDHTTQLGLKIEVIFIKLFLRTLIIFIIYLTHFVN